MITGNEQRIGNPYKINNNEYTVNREIFVGKIFVLKNFRRVDVLRKYFNTKILQHRSREERTERVAAMEKFLITFAATTYIKSMGGDGWRGVGVPKNSSDRYAVAVKNEGTIIEHLPRKLSRVCSLFLRDGEVHSRKCECRARARGMARSIIRIVIICCRKKSL